MSIAIRNSLEGAAPAQLPFDGERFIPGAGVEITYDHWLRYFFALQFASDARVLDVASGEGYGAAYLASRARSVDAFDGAAAAVEHARQTYGGIPNLRFECATVEAYLASAEGPYDLITCFEFIEHVTAEEQQRVLAGLRRLLAPKGRLLISTPDRRVYSEVTLQKNEFHVCELDREEFSRLLATHFPHVRLFEQATLTGSALFESGAQSARVAQMHWTDQLKLKGFCQPGLRTSGKYLVAMASSEPLAGDAAEPALLVDFARKLVGEEVYAKHLEVERLKHADERLAVREAELAQAREELAKTRGELARTHEELGRVTHELATVKHSLTLHEALFERVLSLLARRNDELTLAQRLQSEFVMVKQALEETRAAHAQEAARRAWLEGMLSVKVALRAKGYLDRAPRTKALMKRLLKGA